MKIFNKLDSTRLAKRLEDLRAQLVAAEAAVEARQEDVGAALTEGKPAEKALADLATARGKVEALYSVVARAEAELAEVEAREERARQLKAIAALADRFESTKAELNKASQKILEVAGELERAESAFDSSLSNLREIMSLTDTYNLGLLIPTGTMYGDVRQRNDAASNLNSLLTHIESAISGARAADTVEG